MNPKLKFFHAIVWFVFLNLLVVLQVNASSTNKNQQYNLPFTINVQPNTILPTVNLF